MLLKSLREEVLEANLALPRHGLVTFTWGNVSGFDPVHQWVVIKPSGVRYENMGLADLVILDLDGQIIEGTLRPSSDTPTHLYLYRVFPEIGGIVHTHSTHATAWAQAQRPIPALGTTHADYFHGAVPCTRPLSADEVADAYEHHTGLVIGETLKTLLEPGQALTLPGILVANHAPFTWGKNADEAVHNAVVLEEIARMALLTAQLDPRLIPLPDYLLEKHYQRKHGRNAYYGQTRQEKTK